MNRLNQGAITVEHWRGYSKPYAVYVPARDKQLVIMALPYFRWSAHHGLAQLIYTQVSEQDKSQLVEKLAALLLLPVIYQD